MAEEYDIEIPIEMYDNLKEAKKRVEGAKRLLRRLRGAGLNVESKEAEINEIDKGVRGYRDALFPGKEL